MAEPDVNVNIKKETDNERLDPTSLLPEEPMSFEIKKKKKKKKNKQVDPFKDVEEKYLVTERIVIPDDDGNDTQHIEVNIKVEDVDLEFKYNDVSYIKKKYVFFFNLPFFTYDDI